MRGESNAYIDRKSNGFKVDTCVLLSVVSIMNRLGVPIILCLALFGACVSGSLLSGHDGGWSVGENDSSYLLRLCESVPAESADCAGVIGSRWGSFDLFVGTRRVLVPTSLIGLVYFVSTAIWFSVLGRIPASSRWLWRATLFFVSCGLIGSLAFLGLMAFALSEWCPPCVIAHLFNFGIFATTFRLWRTARHARDHAVDQVAVEAHPEPTMAVPWRFRARLAVFAVFASCFAALSFWLYFDSMVEIRRQWRKLSQIRQSIDEMKSDRGFVLREYFAQPVLDIAPDPSSVMSPADGTPRLVVFVDYDCPGCGCFEFKRKALIDSAFYDDITVEFRHVPSKSARDSVAGSKTPSIESDVLSESSLAAEAARLQGGRSAFERMHNMLFVRPKDGTRRDYASLAARAGLDVERFLGDMAGEVVRNRVLADAQVARALHVDKAPSLFLNGRRVPLILLTSDTFWNAVAEALSQERSLSESPLNHQGKRS